MVLQVVLAALGSLLAIASRMVEGVRRAITRDLVVEIATADGVAHHFVFRDHQMTSHFGHAERADCVLRFGSQSQALGVLLSRHALGGIYAGILDGSISIQGNPFQALWFYDLTQWVVPLKASVAWGTPPGAYVQPSTTVTWAKRITREPVALGLDWKAAEAPRAKLKMWRVAAGEPALDF